MSWKDGFNAALLRFLREELGRDAREVAGFEQQFQEGYRWSEVTADPSRMFITITYRDTEGCARSAEWDGEFGELIGRLTS